MVQSVQFECPFWVWCWYEYE